MLGDILLPNATLEHSGTYFHSKLERTSNAILANATYFGDRNGRRNTWITAIVTLISRADGWPLAATGQARWS